MKGKDEEASCGGGYWDMADDLAEEFDAQEVVPNLYIGSISAANCSTSLKDHKITHILSISTNPPQTTKEFQTLCISIEDEGKKDISSYFQQCHGFIENGRKLGGILIHCTAGVSRSATVVISYLMSIFFKPFWDCFQFLRKIRPCIQPNHGFVNQLISYESELLKKTSTLDHIISTTTTTTTTITVTSKKLDLPPPNTIICNDNSPTTETTISITTTNDNDNDGDVNIPLDNLKLE